MKTFAPVKHFPMTPGEPSQAQPLSALERIWIMEYGAVSLPLGHPARLTCFEAHPTEGEAREAAEECGFDSRAFSLPLPPVDGVDLTSDAPLSGGAGCAGDTCEVCQ